MASSTESPKTKPQSEVALRLNPATGIDEYGTPPLIVAGEVKEFTDAEAAELLGALDPHGVPIFKRVEG